MEAKGVAQKSALFSSDGSCRDAAEANRTFCRGRQENTWV